jgi:hypothetical protein
MDKETFKEMRAEYRSYESCFTGVTGKSMPVRPVPDGDDSLGYTAPKIGIFVAFLHSIMATLSTKAQRFFRTGVFVHEMMHQVFTNFKVSENMLQSIKNPYERQIAATTFNILEDPAIEYMAPTVIGGMWLKALRFTIAHVYKSSLNINESNCAYSQFCNALIQFGDMGLVKGTFTFPEARKCFMKVAPIFDKGVKEPNGAKRIEIGMKIFEMSRPLWTEVVEENEKLDKFLEELEKLGKSAMRGEGEGKTADTSTMPSTESKKEKRRKITIKHVSKEELDELTKNGEISSGPMPDGDITLLVCDDDKPEKKDGEDESVSASGKDTSKPKADEPSEDKKSAISEEDKIE